jgi:uncharacterized membrane protein
VSWPLASFAVLALALAFGFAWYERSHAPAKMVALVAALAALAAAGRVAFAPLPNVKPTTDIVILAGFALGAAPGFTVGAVAALASNVVFGQGPWTPWQMLAWGLCGLLGAFVGHLSRHRVNRWWLALWCALAAFGFGALMDFSSWTTYTGNHTLEEYLAIVATSLPFTIAHAVGNVVFCLAFGPAFLRALLRYRERFSVDWRPVAAVGAVVAAVVLAAGAAGPSRAEAAATPAQRAVAFLKGAQHEDGGFGAVRLGASSALYTDWATMGLASAGVPVRTLRHGGTTLGARLTAYGRSASSAGDLERTILAHASAGLPTAALAKKLRRLQSTDGSFSQQVNFTAFGILALHAAGEKSSSSRITKAVTWLSGQATPSGGYGYTGRFGTAGVDDTAGVVQAFAAAGERTSEAAKKAVTYLLGQQNADGGFSLRKGDTSNAQSTAWAVQAFVAARQDLAAVRVGQSRTPLAYLASLQAANGSIRYSRTSAQTPVWVTSYALMALRKRPLSEFRPR